jgi:hypothetical protein
MRGSGGRGKRRSLSGLLEASLGLTAISAERFHRVQWMDGFALTMVLALAALSCVPPDWTKNEGAAWGQVLVMASGLVVLGVYMILR